MTDSMSRAGDGSPMSDGLTARVGGSTMGLVRAMEQPVEPAFRALPDDSDGALVAAIAGGNRGALARLYDRYAPALLAVGQRLLGGRREAEDLVHDVFLEAWRQSAGYDPARGTVRAWLFIRLRSRALDRHRAASGAPVSIESAEGYEEWMVAGDDPALAPDRAAVRRALETLPERAARGARAGLLRGAVVVGDRASHRRADRHGQVARGHRAGHVAGRTQPGRRAGRVAMNDHVDGWIPELVLGTLEEPARAEVERHIESCRRCAAEAASAQEALSLLALALPPEPPSATARTGLLASIVEEEQRSGRRGQRGRLAAFTDQVARFFDVSRERASALLELAVNPRAWTAGPARGISLIHLMAGPQLAGTDSGLVRMAPGARFPRHRHRGHELGLILEGGFTDADGTVVRSGEHHDLKAGHVARLRRPAGGLHLRGRGPRRPRVHGADHDGRLRVRLGRRRCQRLCLDWPGSRSIPPSCCRFDRVKAGQS